MNRTHHFNYIESKLSQLTYSVEIRGKLNILDLNIHSENFYLHFFNLLFGWGLKNLNSTKHNVEAIDLVDHQQKILVQVSSIATKEKVESALKKDLSAYVGYSFKFISISKDASALRSKTYANPHRLVFNPVSDIYDVPSILSVISALEIEKLKNIAEFIKKELGSEVDPLKVESNLAAIINVLAEKDWSRDKSAVNSTPFEIDRKIEFNKLISGRGIIEDYNIHHARVDRIYTDFDKQGVNKSSAVLAAIRDEYLKHMRELSDDKLFFKVIECVLGRVQNSANYRDIPFEELELCVKILVVDAFIRCKIFKNPEGVANVVAG
jgi:hypothetical protein